jgi:cadmium resistance protein CadD (predicted permease)
METLSQLGIGVVVFASTNVDDIFLLSAFFADPHLRPRSVVAGQFLGIGALVTASAVAALAAVVIPPGWSSLLGLVPLWLGVRRLYALRRATRASPGTDIQTEERRTEQRTGSQALAVAGVTIANGGDNLGVYIPLFASATGAIPVYAAIFAVMTALWCWIGYRLVRNRWVGERLRRYGHLLLPYVLIALGLYILSGARELVR